MSLPAVAFAPPPVPGADETLASSSEEALLLSWDARIRLLFNGDVWRSVLIAFGGATLLFAIFFLIITKDIQALALPAYIFVGIIVMYLLIAIVIDLFGGFGVTFALTTLGVRSVAGKGTGRAAKTAFWVGVLAGKPGVAGAGLLAESEKNVFIAYEEISKVRPRPGSRTIHVKGKLLDKPICLYCTAQNYAQTEAILRQKCPGKVTS